MSSDVSQPPRHLGRDRELELLEQAFDAVRNGAARLVIVSGEAGLGKSTLVKQFVSRISGQVDVVVQGQCVEQYGATEPYLPLLEAVTELCRGARADAWRDAFWRFGPSWLTHMPGLVPDEDWEMLERRTRTTTPGRMLRELTETLAHVATDSTTVIVLEDMHWSDAATVDALEYLLRREGVGKLLIVATFRTGDSGANHALSGFIQRSVQRMTVAEVKLAPLSERDLAALLWSKLPGVCHDAALVRALFERSQGNPLFAQLLIEQIANSTQPPTAEQIGHLMPLGLSAIILNEFQRLEPEPRQLLQFASVAGVEFLAAPLSRASGVSTTLTEQQLERLAKSETFIERSGAATLAVGVSAKYRFRHALYRDALLHSLSPAEQQAHHAALARGLSELYGDRSHEVAAQLATHCEAAGEEERAVGYMLQAGTVANQRAAFVDSVKLLRRALDYLERLPRTPHLDAMQLRIRTAMVPGLLASAGYGSADLEAHCLGAVRGGALHDPNRFPIVHALRNIYFVRADYARAEELGQRVQDSILASEDRTFLAAVLKMTGDTLIFCGDPARGCSRLDEAIAAYDEERDSGQAFVLGSDARVSSLAYGALGKWLVGHSGEALARSERALVFAEQIGHPHTIGTAYVLGSAVQVRLGDFEAVRENAEALAALSRDYGLPAFRAWADIWGGLGEAHAGEASGLERLEQGLEQRRQTGEAVAQSLLLAELADASLLLGDIGRARRAIDAGLEFAKTHGEKSFEPELLRLRGELTLRETSPTEREAKRFASGLFRAAIDQAKRLGTHGLSLRLAISLARTDPDDGGKLLERCYERLRGNLVGRDARDALVLLKTLGLREHAVEIDPASALPQSARLTRRQRRFRQEGDFWTVVYEGSVARVKDSRGMAYLAELMRMPNREVHALELASGGPRDESCRPAVVDAQAKSEYRKRLNELNRALDEAENNNDQAEIERLKDELEWIRQQLAEAFGLGGRARATGSAAERARVSVTRAIKKAVQRIQEVHPSLGEHLHRNIRTGQFCCYDPDRRLSLSWNV